MKNVDKFYLSRYVAPKTSRLQDLTVVQQNVYHMTLRNVYE